jgi:hypothetical protein
MTDGDYRAWHNEDEAFGAWMEAMPVGTFVARESLDRLRWPIDPADESGWLVVACAQHLGIDAYRRWFLQLPTVGVIADPADARFWCTLTRQTDWQ